MTLKMYLLYAAQLNAMDLLSMHVTMIYIQVLSTFESLGFSRLEHQTMRIFLYNFFAIYGGGDLDTCPRRSPVTTMR